MKRLITIFLLISIVCSVFIPRSAHAEAWGTNMGAAIWKETMEQIKKKIYEQLLANLRIVAIKIIQGRLMTLLTGSPGGGYGAMGTNGMIISNWRQFIYGTSSQYSTQITNNFFSNARSGIPGPLAQRIIDPAQKAVMGEPKMPNLQYYVREGRADMTFQPGWAQNPRAAWLAGADPRNDLAYWLTTGSDIRLESARQKEEEQKVKGTVGGGYKDVTTSSGKQVTVPPGSNYTGASGTSNFASVLAQSENEKITTPGSTVKDLASKVLGMNLDTVSLTQSIPDIVSNLVVSMLTRFLNQGLVNITQTMDRQIMQVRGQTGLGSMGQVQNLIQSGFRTTPNTYFGR